MYGVTHKCNSTSPGNIPMLQQIQSLKYGGSSVIHYRTIHHNIAEMYLDLIFIKLTKG